MTTSSRSQVPGILKSHEQDIMAGWSALQRQSLSVRRDPVNEPELQRLSRDFLTAFTAAAETEGLEDVHKAGWNQARETLSRLSQSLARQGFTAAETATVVMSLKHPIFATLNKTVDKNALAAETWTASMAIDALALFTTEAYQKSRDEVILRQQQEMLELSTPVVTLWTGILALPLIGTLDSARTQVVMESLLQRIVESGSTIAILDITGVPTVDTLVAQHLLKTVAAARLMGADCIISGIRPQIAQTIVHLGVDLASVTTKATLADAFAVALKRTGLAVVKSTPAAR
jgi:rsbT co-antagonist protein RsbR